MSVPRSSAAPRPRPALAGALGLLLLLAVLFVAAPARAATGLVADRTLSTDTDAHDTVGAFAPNGTGATAWIETLPGGGSAIQVALRPAGGDWSAPQQLAVRPTDDRSGLRLAINASGAAAVSWEEPSGVAVATRTPGQPFGAAETVADASAPAVGLDAAGNVTLAYGATVSRVVTFAAGTPAQAAAPRAIGKACSSDDDVTTALAVAPSGDAVLGVGCSGVRFAVRRGGSWTDDTVISSGSFSGHCSGGSGAYTTAQYLAADPQVAIDATGRIAATIVRTRADRLCAGGADRRLASDVRLLLPVNGQLVEQSEPVASADSARDDAVPPSPIGGVRVGTGADGAVVAWRATPSGPAAAGQIEARRYALDGAPAGPAQAIGDATAVEDPQLAVAANGQALLAWSQAPAANPAARSIVVAERPPGGSFGAPLAVNTGSEPAGDATVAIADQGDGLIAYRQQDGGRALPHARGFDGAAPMLADLAIPASAQAGTAVPFSVTAGDVWSPVSLRWSFGDGTTSDAATPQHVFAGPRSYAVSVTATDALGNATVRTGTISVWGVATHPGPKLTAPRLLSVTLTPPRFRVGPKTKRTASGTTIRFRLERKASVTLAFARRQSVRCPKGQGRKRCVRWRSEGKLTRSNLGAGAHRIRFSGRIGKRKLAVGEHRVVLTARAGGKTGKPVSVRFRIVR